MPAISNNRFVVVGGASLLGSHIGQQLLEAGAGEVVLLDNLALGSTSAIEDLLADKRCTFLRGDMTKLHELLDPFKGAAGVFSVAGFLGGPMLANPWAGLDVNVRGVQNVLEASRVQGVKKVIYSSSSGVYGKMGAEPNSEDSPFSWQSLPPALILYSGSKIVGEGLCRLYQQLHGVDTVSFRYAALYGEKQHTRAIDATRIVQAWESVRAGKPPVIQGTGMQVLDLIYVGDVAQANVMAMEGSATGEFNIVSGVDVSFNEVIDALLKACGSDLKPEHNIDTAKVANVVEARMQLSREKAKREFGWEPKVDVEEGMRRLVGWLDSRAAKQS